MRNIMPAFCLLIVISGCSYGPVVPTSIQGKILVQKQPLRGGTIVFTPDMERGSVGPMASGEIFPDGTYPDNELGQKKYPRYEFFQKVIEVFKKKQK